MFVLLLKVQENLLRIHQAEPENCSTTKRIYLQKKYSIIKRSIANGKFLSFGSVSSSSQQHSNSDISQANSSRTGLQNTMRIILLLLSVFLLLLLLLLLLFTNSFITLQFRSSFFSSSLNSVCKFYFFNTFFSFCSFNSLLFFPTKTYKITYCASPLCKFVWLLLPMSSFQFSKLCICTSKQRRHVVSVLGAKLLYELWQCSCC